MPQPPQESVASARILLVEDHHLIAKLAADLLRELGHEPVGPAASMSQARELLESQHVDAAMLDVRVADGEIFPLATHLRSRGIPFVFCSCYDDNLIVPDDLRNAPFVTKPYDEDRLAEALADSLSR